MRLWNADWSQQELVDRLGSIAQLGGITPLEYSDGRARGVRMLQVRTAKGFEFTIVPDRGMDLFSASYCGKSLCWHSPVGMVHPAFYDPRDIQWVKTFGGGLLTTCGLTTAGEPSEDDGELLGLHGTISNIPAENVTWSATWDKDDIVFRINGKVREVRVHGCNLLLDRTISTTIAASHFHLNDIVCNEGMFDTPLMCLYHLNFGFPLLTDHSLVFAPSTTVSPRDKYSAETREKWAEFEPPTRGIAERAYYHTMKPDSDGSATVVLVSDRRTNDFGVALRYETTSLPRFVQWKMTGTNHYVLGLEPANCLANGRRAERESGTLKILHPGERVAFRLELRVLTCADEVASAISAAKGET